MVSAMSDDKDAAADADPFVGLTIADRYRIIRPLGVGGMGTVYVAEQARLGREVALKMVHASHAGDPVTRARFENEARVVAALRHPNVVTVYDFGDHQDTFQYIAMELLTGEDLRMRLDREHRLSPALTVDVLRGVAAGLAAAHNRGLVHRDLKPDNVFLAVQDDETVTVKVLDFGISRSVEELGDPRLTTPGGMVGTPGYFAPELATEPARPSPQSDLYAVGVLAFELLTGHQPYTADTAIGLTVRHITTPTPRPSAVVPNAGIPRALDELVMGLMAKSPADRLPDGSALIAALEAIGMPSNGELSAPTLPDGSLEGQVDTEPEGPVGLVTAVDDEAPNLDDELPGMPVVESLVPQLPRRSMFSKSLIGLLALLLGGIFAALVLSSRGDPATDRQGEIGEAAIAIDASVAPAPPKRFLRVALSRWGSGFDLVESMEALGTAKPPSVRRVALSLIVESVGARVEVSTGDDGALRLAVDKDARFHVHPCLGPDAPRAPTSDDVAASIALAARHGGPGPRATSSTVIDPQTVELRLATPPPSPESVDAWLARVPLVPGDFERCEKPAHVRHPTGTGPFAYDGEREGEVRLRRVTAAGERESEDQMADGIRLSISLDPVRALHRLGANELDVVYLDRVAMPEVLDWAGTRRPGLKNDFITLDAVVAAPAAPRDEAVIGLLALRGGALDTTAARRRVHAAVDRAALVDAVPALVRTVGETPTGAAPRRPPLRLAIGYLAPDRPVLEALEPSFKRAGARIRLTPLTNAQLAAPAATDVDAALITAHAEPGAWPLVAARRALDAGHDDDSLRAAVRDSNPEAAIAALTAEHIFIPLAAIDAEVPTAVYVVHRRVEGLADPLTGRLVGDAPDYARIAIRAPR